MVTPPRSEPVSTERRGDDNEGSAAVVGLQSNTNQNLFVPHVLGVEVPTVGKTFTTDDEAFLFYNTYAKAAGFSVRKANCIRNKAGEYRLRIFTCSREGLTDESYQEKRKYSQPRNCERNRGHTRCQCEASMNVKRVANGEGWVVSKFVEKHSHPLESPKKVQFLTSHRRISKSKKRLVDEYSEANVPVCQQIRYFEAHSGGPSSVGFRERDLRNYKRDLRQKLLGHDAESLIYFFEREKSRNSDSYYVYDTETIEFDDGKKEQVFKRCFWADCVSRNAYGHTVRTCPRLVSSTRLVDEDDNDSDVYRPDLSNMESGVDSNLQQNLYTSDGLDDDTMLQEEYLRVYDM